MRKLDNGLDPMVAWEFGGDFNKNHPELLPGEIFYTNVSLDESGLLDAMPLASKRLGEKAYARDGTALKNALPVFVRGSELEGLSAKNGKPEAKPEKTERIN